MKVPQLVDEDEASAELRQVQARLHRNGDHKFVPAILNVVLLLATRATFPDSELKDVACGSFVAWLLVLVAAVWQTGFGLLSEGPKRGPLLSDERSSLLTAPGCSTRVFGADDIAGFALTAMVFYSACRWWTSTGDAYAGSATFWWAVMCYVMYLIHALGGDLFLCLVRSAAAEYRARPASDGTGIDGHAASLDVDAVLAPLLGASPQVFFEVEGSNRAGKKAVVTHWAKEWVPMREWRDITDVPEDARGDECLGLVSLTLLMRLKAGTSFEDAERRFTENHRHDKYNRVKAGLLVARLEDTATWVGLWRGPRFHRGLLRWPGSLAVGYFLASCFVSASLARCLVRALAVQLTVVVRKEVVCGERVNTTASPTDGWHLCSAAPGPSGRIGLRGWTFTNESGEGGGERDEDEPQGEAAPFRMLPHITLYDFAAQWLRQRTKARAAVTTGAFVVNAVLAALSVRARGLTLAALVLIGPLICLQLLSSQALARDRLKWRDCPSCVLAAAVLLGTLASIGLFIYCSLWLAVQWEFLNGLSAPASVPELRGKAFHDAWAVWLSDGFVDTSQTLSQHLVCSGDNNASVPCDYIYTAPIFGSATAAQLALKSGGSAAAWAVDVKPIAGTIACPVRHGLCGLVARRYFWHDEIRRFRALVANASNASPTEDDGPAMVFLADPATFFVWEPRAALGAILLLIVLSPIGLSCLSQLFIKDRPAGIGGNSNGDSLESNPARMLKGGSTIASDEIFAGQRLLDAADELAGI